MFAKAIARILFSWVVLWPVGVMAGQPPYVCCELCTGPNTATNFEGAWAFNGPGGIHVCWVTAGEHNTLFFEVYRGCDRSDVVARVDPQGEDASHFYEVTVPYGELFEVVEFDGTRGAATSSRLFAIGRPPENLKSLRELNALTARVTEARRNGRVLRATPTVSSASVQVTDYVFYSSRQDFLDATLPVRNRFASRNLTSQTILGTKDPYACKAAMQAVWQQAINQGYPRLPFLVIVGNAYEDIADPRNIVGTIYYPDVDGACFFAGGCASDVRIVDFDGDDLPDVPWTRILGTNLTEINNTVLAALYYYGRQHIKPQRAFILDGNLNDVCAPVVEPRLTLEAIADRYSAKGIPTVIRHESDYTNCSAYAEKLADVVQIFQTGITEMLGTGYTTNRSKLPGWIIQKVYSPVFTMDAVPFRQLFVAELPGCELGGEDRLNPSYYPTIMQMFLTANPNTHATAVAWFGHKRGGWDSDHLEFARRYFEKRLAVRDHTTTLHDVYFSCIREVGLELPSLRRYLLLCGAYGWPVQLPDMMLPDSPCRDCPIIAETSAGSAAPPTTLEQNYPNPFNPVTTIRYAVGTPARVTLTIYNVRGQRVVTLVDVEAHETGWFEKEWDGSDDRGNGVASGVYFCRLVVGKEAFTRKMLLLQ